MIGIFVVLLMFGGAACFAAALYLAIKRDASRSKGSLSDSVTKAGTWKSVGKGDLGVLLKAGTCAWIAGAVMTFLAGGSLWSF